MSRSFPSDVVVLDHDSLLHARFARGKSGLRLVQSRFFRMAAETFTPSLVSPQLAEEAALADALRRLRLESGTWEKVSVLLPDAWFRINIVELASLPDREAEARDVVRWSLKRTLPIPPEQLRIAWTVLDRNASGARVLVLSALEETLGSIERVFAAAGFDVVLIEPVGLNLWNAIAVREPDTEGDRLFLYVREGDFTTAVFRGAQPLFIRSRQLHADRSIDQEIRLSASYLRDSLNVSTFVSCHLAGIASEAVRNTLAEEFQTQVRPVTLRDYVEDVSAGVVSGEAELTACSGVFTG